MNRVTKFEIRKFGKISKSTRIDITEKKLEKLQNFKASKLHSIVRFFQTLRKTLLSNVNDFLLCIECIVFFDLRRNDSHEAKYPNIYYEASATSH